MESLDLMRFANFPIAPVLRSVLGFTDQIDTAVAPTLEEWALFEDALAPVLSAEVGFLDHDTIATILEELVLMKLPKPALTLAAKLDEGVVQDDFRKCLAIGIAAMMVGDFGRAEESLISAQNLIPAEISPYVNLAELYYRQERDADCRIQIEKGIAIERNQPSLWELRASLAIQAMENSIAVGEFLRDEARRSSSWVGMSLAADQIAPEDAMLKAEFLEELFAAGIRDDDFMTEYTAALGVALSYEKLLETVKLHELRIRSSGKLPWQIYAHAAQASLALEKHSDAQRFLNLVFSDPDLRPEARTELLVLSDEVNSKLSTEVLQ